MRSRFLMRASRVGPLLRPLAMLGLSACLGAASGAQGGAAARDAPGGAPARDAPAGAAPTHPGPAQDASIQQAHAPFARVYLALRGCTSCSHCRTTIRQMVNAKSGGGLASVRGDQVEVTYPKPKPVPLRAVIRNLAENRLHDLSLVDVLFEAGGTLRTGPGGAAIFTLPTTNQSFPVSIDRALRVPADGTPVRLVALVDGWRGQGEITLVAREIRKES